MDSGTSDFIIGLAGSVTMICLLILGFFLKIVHGDVRKNTAETGRNKGRFDQLEIQLEREKEMRAKENEYNFKTTQQSIQQLAGEVTKMTKMMEIFIQDRLTNNNS